ncbi:ABC transporter substrate-binding protein [Nocardiopsis sp. N85]|uniref:ABC transporter substrate-binding protein n=1 Tax=Nocardiopsis sp. N85 TaxID=3029400 RepID=UPI00237FD128|nr:ABC transporter substrate-binding protein [Nocardiopsis sp. N85]MDE3722934.1 ABC transporter substrate-binding protein [Nocardiopsis sp. N85]
MNHPSATRGGRSLTAFALTGAAALMLSACGTSVAPEASPEAETAEGYPLTVENCGTDLTFEAAPTSVVGLSPSQTELLVELGLADRLVGQAQVAHYELDDDVTARIADVPVLSEDTPPTREDLLNVAPDFVYSPTGYEFTAEQGFASIEQLSEAGANAYTATGGCFDRRAVGTVDDLFTDIENLGLIFSVPGPAEELADQGRERLEAVTDTIGDAERTSVAQLYVEGTTVSAIGGGVEYDIIDRAGGANVFDRDEPAFADFFAAVITPEEVTSRDPDVIVFAVNDDDHEAATRAHLAETFPDVAAVAEDRLVAIPNSDLFPGTLGNIDAVERIAAELHPELF